MYRYIFCLLIPFSLILTTELLAQKFDLKLGKDAVYNEIKYQLDVKNYNKSTFTVERRVTIFNKNGAAAARALVAESKLVKYKNMSVKIYDLSGKELEKSKDDNIKESSFSGGAVLYDDTRYKGIDLKYHRYPYQAVIITQVEFKTLFLWPDWYPQKKYPVMKTSYELKIPDEVGFRTQMTGMDIKPEIHRHKGRSTYKWSLNDVDALEPEDFIAPEHRINKFLQFAPDRFQLGNYQGDMSSWNSFAKWYRSMLGGLLELPPEAVAAVNELSSRYTDKKELVTQLYRYLQTQTRYVAIYLDIGGWQPNKAEDVFQNKYGDCKDLSIFMVAMLEKAGIKAYPALALTRDNGIVDPEFPSNQFNHCIAVVPMETDTLWLECTADYLAANEMPASLEGTHVLLVKENGGELVQVPSSKASQNYWVGNINGIITVNGSLEITGEVLTGGEQGKWVRVSNYAQNKDDERIWMKKVLGRNVSQLDFDSYNLLNMRENLSDPAIIRFEGKLANFASKSASRFFLNPNVFNQIHHYYIPEESIEEREFPVYEEYPYVDYDTVRINLPAGLIIEAAPEKVELKTSFGSYQMSYALQENQLIYTRSFSIEQSSVPVEKYQEYLDFMTTVSKSDESKFVLKRQ